MDTAEIVKEKEADVNDDGKKNASASAERKPVMLTCYRCENPVPEDDAVFVNPYTGVATTGPLGEPYHTRCAPPELPKPKCPRHRDAETVRIRKEYINRAGRRIAEKYQCSKCGRTMKWGG